MRNAASVLTPVALLVVAAVALIAGLRSARGRAPAAMLQPIDSSQFVLVELPRRAAGLRDERRTFFGVHAIHVCCRRACAHPFGEIEAPAQTLSVSPEPLNPAPGPSAEGSGAEIRQARPCCGP